MQRKISRIKREMHKKFSVMVVTVNLIVRNFLFHLTVCMCVCLCVFVHARGDTHMHADTSVWTVFRHVCTCVWRLKIKLGYQFARAIFLAS